MCNRFLEQVMLLLVVGDERDEVKCEFDTEDRQVFESFGRLEVGQ